MTLASLNEFIRRRRFVEGRWRLTPGHELQYRGDRRAGVVRLRGTLIAAEPEGLVVSVAARHEDGTIVSRLVTLAGTWSANAKNQLQFEIERTKGRRNVLTFTGGWTVNDAQELTYTYAREDLKTRRLVTHTLVFRGRWDLSERHRLTYVLGGDSRSIFRFRGAFQTASILAKRGEIRYQMGVEVRGRWRIQTITLFGAWKLSRDLMLQFEIERTGGRRRPYAITFGGTYALDDTATIAVQLRSRQGERLGVEILFTRDVFGKDGQAFLRLARSLGDSRVEAGVTARF